jgi:hypothetical protein
MDTVDAPGFPVDRPGARSNHAGRFEATNP